MKFFFPDSQDFVDPSFDMITEERSEYRVRQRDDLYAHEIFNPPPFDAEEAPPPMVTPPPLYDHVVGTPSHDGLADYFDR